MSNMRAYACAYYGACACVRFAPTRRRARALARLAARDCYQAVDDPALSVEHRIQQSRSKESLLS